jgi:hypothetical protein
MRSLPVDPLVVELVEPGVAEVVEDPCVVGVPSVVEVPSDVGDTPEVDDGELDPWEVALVEASLCSTVDELEPEGERLGL